MLHVRWSCFPQYRLHRDHVLFTCVRHAPGFHLRSPQKMRSAHAVLPILIEYLEEEVR